MCGGVCVCGRNRRCCGLLLECTQVQGSECVCVERVILSSSESRKAALGVFFCQELVGVRARVCVCVEM